MSRPACTWARNATAPHRIHAHIFSKVEINTREHFSVLGFDARLFHVLSPSWRT